MTEDQRVAAASHAVRKVCLANDVPVSFEEIGRAVLAATDALECHGISNKATHDLVAALSGLLIIVHESQGVVGFHLNGEVATWDEFEEEVSDAEQALAKARGDTE